MQAVPFPASSSFLPPVPAVPIVYRSSVSALGYRVGQVSKGNVELWVYSVGHMYTDNSEPWASEYVIWTWLSVT